MRDVLQMMSALDILIAGSIIASVVVSLLRGGVRELASIAALVVGFYIAARFYGLASEQVFRITSHPEVNDTISFLVIFLFVAALISYGGGQLTEMIKKSKLRGWNTLLGFMLGLLRGVLIACFLVYGLLVMLPYDSETFTHSKLFPYAVAVADVVSPIGPTSFREDFNRKLAKYREVVAKKTGLPESVVPEVKLPVKTSKAGAAEVKPAAEEKKTADEKTNDTGKEEGNAAASEPPPLTKGD